MAATARSQPFGARQTPRSCPITHRRWSALRAGYTLLTFLFGLWAIPWGPIWTYRALSHNLHATGISVGELLEGKPDVDIPRASSARQGAKGSGG